MHGLWVCWSVAPYIKQSGGAKGISSWTVLHSARRRTPLPGRPFLLALSWSCCAVCCARHSLLCTYRVCSSCATVCDGPLPTWSNDPPVAMFRGDGNPLTVAPFGCDYRRLRVFPERARLRPRGGGHEARPGGGQGPSGRRARLPRDPVRPAAAGEAPLRAACAPGIVGERDARRARVRRRVHAEHRGQSDLGAGVPGVTVISIFYGKSHAKKRGTPSLRRPARSPPTPTPHTSSLKQHPATEQKRAHTSGTGAPDTTRQLHWRPWRRRKHG